MSNKPDADQIVADARKLQSERFQKRDQLLKKRASERFNETKVEVPSAYQTTAHQHDSSVIEDEGRQIGTLVYATPTPHIPPGKPEDQPLTTTEEKFLMAAHAEAESTFGPVWWQNQLAQVHDNIAWLYAGWRKVPYKGQPAPPDTAEMEPGDAMVADATYTSQNDQFKRDAGVRAYLDYRYVPTATAYPQGNIYDPDRFYEIKEVPERDLMDTYGVQKNSDGSFSPKTADPQTMPSGYAQDKPGTETMVKVVEYWDREWCQIVAETTKTKWLGTRQVKEGYLLTEWQHGWGRVPYFARPAFVTDQLAEEKKFSGPLDAVYTEMPMHKKLRTMGFSVAYMTAFSPLQLVSAEDNNPVLDDNSKPMTFLELVPGQARVLPPGTKIEVTPQSPEVANFWQEVAASQARIEHGSLSPVAKGVAPGADTANAALSNLHRFQLSTLDPLAQQASRQASAMYRFWLERIEDMSERVYVFDSDSDQYLSLQADEIVSLNVQAKVVPDQGQFQLLIEKHVMELYLSPKPIITLMQAFEMMGKENPDELALEVQAEQLADSLQPVFNNQIIGDLGMLDAVKRMAAMSAQGGSARDAVPQIMDQVRQMNDQNGQGQGSEGQPRTNGVRSPVVSQTTQPQLTSGGY